MPQWHVEVCIGDLPRGLRKPGQGKRAPRLGAGGLGSDLILLKTCGETLRRHIHVDGGLSTGLSCDLVMGRAQVRMAQQRV